MERSTVYLGNEVHAFTKSLIRLLFVLLICCYIGKTDGQITNLLCWNDYDTKMVCSWESMGLQTNCTTKYQMFYERDVLPLPSNICIPENVKVAGSILTNKCACTVDVIGFQVADQYLIEIWSEEELLANKTLIPIENIKPKKPGNLAIDFNENGDSILTWDKNYPENEIICDYMSFEINYYNKHDPSQNFNSICNQKETRFLISKSQLKSGGEYVAKVRAKLREDSPFAGYWSDFSHEVEWYNDRTNESFTPNLFFICFLIIPLVIICYCSIRVIKKKHWEMIPDPSKSNILFTFIGKSQVSENVHLCSKNCFEKKEWCHLKVTCSRWLARFTPCLLDPEFVLNHVPKTVDNQPADGSHKMFDSSFPKSQSERNLRENQNILIPECISVEPFVILSKPDNIDADEKGSHDEDRLESDTAHTMFCNSSINEMFHDLLGMSMSPLENSVMVGDENNTSDNSDTDKALQPKGNSQGPTIFSFFTESIQPSEEVGSCDSTVYSPKQSTESCESGYRSFESEVGHFEPKVSADTMSIPDAQSLPTNQDGNCHLEEVAKTTEFDSQYRSFSSAISECENQAGESGKKHGQWPTTSLGTFFVNSPLVYNTDQAQGSDTNLQIYNYEIGSNCQSVYPQNATKHDFPFWESEQNLLFLPNRELLAEISELDMGSINSKMDSATLYDPSGYQSFENAVKQEKTSNLDEDADGALSDIVQGKTKAETPFAMFSWDSDSQDLGKLVDPDMCAFVSPFLFNEASLMGLCRLGIEETKEELSTTASDGYKCGTIGVTTDINNQAHESTMKQNKNVDHCTSTLNADKGSENLEVVNTDNQLFKDSVSAESNFGNYDPVSQKVQKIPEVHFPLNYIHSDPSHSLPLKYDNATYFKSSPPFLKEDYHNTAAERKIFKNEMVKLNEAMDTEGNLYMTVTEME